MKPATRRSGTPTTAPAPEPNRARRSAVWQAMEQRSPVGLYQTDAAGACVYVNERWCQLAGLAGDEALGDGWSRALHPDDRERIVAAWSRAAATASPFADEYRFLHPDGTVVWAYGQATPEIDDAGNVVAFVGSVTDISERRIAEEALRTSEARFRALADATAAAFWTVDETGGPRDAATTRWPYLTDLPPDEIAGEWLAAVHPGDREPGNAVWQAGLAEGRPFAFEQRVRQRDGSWRHFMVRTAPVRDADGAVREWVGADIDITQRKRAEAGLRERDELLRLTLQAARAGAWVRDLASGREEWSPEIFPLLGRQPDEIAPGFDDLLAVVHPDDRDLLRNQASADIPAGRDGQAEFRVVWPDGSVHWILARGRNIIDAAGAPRRVGLMLDITERKQAEEALRESEERYRTLFERIDQGFCIIEMIYGPYGEPCDYRFEEVNPTFSRHTGLTDAVGKTARELVPGLEGEWIEAYAQVAETGERRHFEQGSAAMGRWFEVEAVRVGGERSRRVALLFSDVTERKQNDERLRLGIDVAGFALLEIDYDAGVIHLSAEAARLYGLGDDAVTLPREQVHAAFHPDDRDELTRRIARAPSPDIAEPYTTEYRVVWPSGEVRWLSVRKQIVFDRAGPTPRPARAIMAALDVTERKQAEADRQALLDALAHDLRNPLTALKIQAQLLLRQFERGRAPDRDALAERVSGFAELASRMTGLIDDLEAHARLAAGVGLRPDREPTDLVALARASVEELQQSGGTHAIRLATDETALVGAWDPLHVRRVLDNLLGNAVKYSPEGSEVQVRLFRVGRFGVVEVRDEGIGIPAADLPHIFAFRHRGGNVGAVAGSGVGLAGVKQVVERHGGTVTVQSEEGRGSVFTVRLPLLVSGR